ncbi:MAG: sigma-70 family RNA polymerase sigma factor, partial [Planctomycetota bacterium]
PDPVPPTEPAGFDDVGSHVAACVGRLPRRQREVAVLVLLEDLNPADAAIALDLTPQNVRVHLFHARQKLQDMLRPLLDDSQTRPLTRPSSRQNPVQ